MSRRIHYMLNDSYTLILSQALTKDLRLICVYCIDRVETNSNYQNEQKILQHSKKQKQQILLKFCSTKNVKSVLGSFLLKENNLYISKILLILEREGERERERDFVHSLVDSCMCPDLRSNPKPWPIRRMFQSPELPGQGNILFI